MVTPITKPYSFPSDVYSFGLMIYALISLKIPEYNEKPDWPDNLDESSSYLRSLFLNCTYSEPELRPDLEDIKLSLMKREPLKWVKDSVSKKNKLAPKKRIKSLEQAFLKIEK
eukprot:TRINITY_DN3352_c0_g1_i2.p1 TRINITY_DN3352_c0_g1~~TRINITY_DN3352_c0_g1_i2.p1  ORF type:complete len:113 (+),score=16.38 TRINITY_DN3352_c0_g1_i2:737-1075(+)